MPGVIRYPASFDNLVKGITAFVCLLFLIVGWLQGSDYLKAGGDLPAWPVLLFTLLFVSLIVVTWLLHIKGYTLKENSLVIHRPIGDVIIGYKDIENVQHVEEKDMRWTVRTFGNGGLFGFYGKFWNNKFGHMSWYATQRKNFILIKKRDNKKVVITPDDIALFDELNTRLAD